MYQIEEISWLWLGIIPILVVILFAIDRIWKSKIQNRFASNEVILKLSPNISLFKPALAAGVDRPTVSSINLSLALPLSITLG